MSIDASWSGPTRTDDDASSARHIDYLAKDYESFREFLLQRLASLAPEWQERHAADLGIAIVELLAYAGDLLSYRQDAVALEAYLDTAVRRVSAARLARLLGYRLDNGCNARALVEVWPTMGSLLQPAGTTFCTSLGGDLATTVSVEEFAGARGPETIVFESMREVRLIAGNNELGFESIGPRTAVLRGRLDHLEPGSLLLVKAAAGRQPGVHHPVMIRHAQIGEQATLVEWSSEDRIPGLLETATGDDAIRFSASTNVVAVDHGETTWLPVATLARRDGRIVVPGPSITSTATQALTTTSAAALLGPQDPQSAVPAIALHDDTSSWLSVADLLDVGRFAQAFVAEIENDGSAQLRFAAQPDAALPRASQNLRCAFRIGNGTAGNIASHALCHIVADGDETTIASRLLNAEPARGGRDPEPLDQIRLFAPLAHLSTDERCIIPADYARQARSVVGVDQATTTFQPQGIRSLVRVHVQPTDQAHIPTTIDRVRTRLRALQAVGHTLIVQPVDYLDVSLSLTVNPEVGADPSLLEAALISKLQGVDQAFRARGLLFDNGLAIGETLHQSTLLETALAVPGVALVAAELLVASNLAPVEEARPHAGALVRLAANAAGRRSPTIRFGGSL